MNRITVAFIILILAGCSYPYFDKNCKTLHIHKLKAGMSMDEVIRILGRKPLFKTEPFEDGDNILETWRYIQKDCRWGGGRARDKYAPTREFDLHFYNSKLKTWENVTLR